MDAKDAPEQGAANEVKADPPVADDPNPEAEPVRGDNAPPIDDPDDPDLKLGTDPDPEQKRAPLVAIALRFLLSFAHLAVDTWTGNTDAEEVSEVDGNFVVHSGTSLCSTTSARRILRTRVSPSRTRLSIIMVGLLSYARRRI